ncbi:PhoH family protein [bacterium]|nr:PhoH family protein [bacterium]
MKKIFVVDTNVLLHNPDAVTSFSDNIVVLPIDVLEELDRFKKDHDEKGRNARITIRLLDSLRETGSLKDGVPLENGGILRIITHRDFVDVPGIGLSHDITDNRVILTAYRLNEQENVPVIFVSKDINARVKADSLGIVTQDFEKQKVNLNELYAGWQKISVGAFPEPDGSSDHRIQFDEVESLHPNEFCLFEQEKTPGKYMIAKKNPNRGKLYPLAKQIDNLWGISPRNPQQEMAQELLLDPSIELVSLVGQAGTGKTLLALAAGLYMVLEKRMYDRLLISRPIMPLGRDLGYLPGSKEEKLENWMEPIFDNLQYILSVHQKESMRKYYNIYELLESDIIELEALTYMRGRSIPRQYIIIDEAQNLTPHEIKTVVTRSGTNSKMILTGDPYQIDNPYLDSDSNGLTYCVDRMKNEALFGHVTLMQSERGKLASIAANLL